MVCAPWYEQRNAGHLVTNCEVTKVGSKWVHFKMYGREHKFDLNTMMVDAGQYTPSDKIFLSEQEYHDEVKLNSAIDKFFRNIEQLKFRHSELTLEKIDAVNNILGF